MILELLRTFVRIMPAVKLRVNDEHIDTLDPVFRFLTSEYPRTYSVVAATFHFEKKLSVPTDDAIRSINQNILTKRRYICLH